MYNRNIRSLNTGINDRASFDTGEISISGANGFTFVPGYSMIRCTNGVVNIRILLQTSIPNGFADKIGQIDSQYIPLTDVWFPIYHSNGGSKIARGMVKPDGNINVVNHTGTAIDSGTGSASWGLR